MVLLFVFHKPLLRWSAHAWVVDHSSIEKVDAVIIPGGGIQTRPFAAAEWYHAGKSGKLVTFNVKPSPTEELGLSQPSHERNLAVLKGLKVPEEAIEVIGDKVSSTQDEVIATKKWAESAGMKSIAVVTEAFPSRRVDWAYRNKFEGSNIEVHIVALPPAGYSLDEWWLEEGGIISFQNEIIKYIYYLARY